MEYCVLQRGEREVYESVVRKSDGASPQQIADATPPSAPEAFAHLTRRGDAIRYVRSEGEPHEFQVKGIVYKAAVPLIGMVWLTEQELREKYQYDPRGLDGVLGFEEGKGDDASRVRDWAQQRVDQSLALLGPGPGRSSPRQPAAASPAPLPLSDMPHRTNTPAPEGTAGRLPWLGILAGAVLLLAVVTAWERSKLNGKIDDLNQQLARKTDKTDFDLTVSRFETRLKDLSERVAAQPEEIGKLQKHTSELESQINDLRGKLDQMKSNYPSPFRILEREPQSTPTPTPSTR